MCRASPTSSATTTAQKPGGSVMPPLSASHGGSSTAAGTPWVTTGTFRGGSGAATPDGSAHAASITSAMGTTILWSMTTPPSTVVRLNETRHEKRERHAASARRIRTSGEYGDGSQDGGEGADSRGERAHAQESIGRELMRSLLAHAARQHAVLPRTTPIGRASNRSAASGNGWASSRLTHCRRASEALEPNEAADSDSRTRYHAVLGPCRRPTGEPEQARALRRFST